MIAGMVAGLVTGLATVGSEAAENLALIGPGTPPLGALACLRRAPLDTPLRAPGHVLDTEVCRRGVCRREYAHGSMPTEGRKYVHEGVFTVGSGRGDGAESVGGRENHASLSRGATGAGLGLGKRRETSW